MDDNMEVSGALRIKEEERIKKQTALSCTHLERNNGRLNYEISIRLGAL